MMVLNSDSVPSLRTPPPSSADWSAHGVIAENGPGAGGDKQAAAAADAIRTSGPGADRDCTRAAGGSRIGRNRAVDDLCGPGREVDTRSLYVATVAAAAVGA